MVEAIIIGASAILAGYVTYIFFKRKNTAKVQSPAKEIENILNSTEYKVKGRFD